MASYEAQINESASKIQPIYTIEFNSNDPNIERKERIEQLFTSPRYNNLNVYISSDERLYPIGINSAELTIEYV